MLNQIPSFPPTGIFHFWLHFFMLPAFMKILIKRSSTSSHIDLLWPWTVAFSFPSFSLSLVIHKHNGTLSSFLIAQEYECKLDCFTPWLCLALENCKRAGDCKQSCHNLSCAGPNSKAQEDSVWVSRGRDESRWNFKLILLRCSIYEAGSFRCTEPQNKSTPSMQPRMVQSPPNVSSIGFCWMCN